MKERLIHFIDDLEIYLKNEEKKGMRYVLGDFKDQEPLDHIPAAAAEDGVSRVLEEMEKKVSLCTRCSLFSSRKNTVFGEGSKHADLVFVGEAPGADEDEQGRPFVGAAGRLLTKIIEAIGLKREDVYICNILKCRPPGNRNPLPSEIVECREFVLQQLDTIRPKIICTLGSIATQVLLETTEGITKLRGRFFDFRGTKLIPTFHPAYLLRNASKKREVWEDMKNIKKELEKQ